MQKFNFVLATVLATALAGTSVLAATGSSADKAASGSSAVNAASGSAANTANEDFGKLSVDGAQAFSDIGLARLAIYDGKTDMAGKLIGEAQGALERASTADTVFTKAESALRPPAALRQASPANTTPVAWIPVDAQYTVDETLTPEKAAAVNQANEKMHQKQPDAAREALQVANVDASMTVTVAPLSGTSTDVAKAAQLFASHDYYGASQSLRQAQVAVRYDTVDIGAPPASASASTASSAKTPG